MELKEYIFDIVQENETMVDGLTLSHPAGGLRNMWYNKAVSEISPEALAEMNTRADWQVEAAQMALQKTGREGLTVQEAVRLRKAHFEFAVVENDLPKVEKAARNKYRAQYPNLYKKAVVEKEALALVQGWRKANECERKMNEAKHHKSLVRALRDYQVTR